MISKKSRKNDFFQKKIFGKDFAFFVWEFFWRQKLKIDLFKISLIFQNFFCEVEVGTKKRFLDFKFSLISPKFYFWSLDFKIFDLFVKKNHKKCHFKCLRLRWKNTRNTFLNKIQHLDSGFWHFQKFQKITFWKLSRIKYTVFH